MQRQQPCIDCLQPTERVCRACGVSLCLVCQQDGLCGVCLRLAQYRREQVMLARLVPAALRLPALPVFHEPGQGAAGEERKSWTARLTRNLAELPTEPNSYETVEIEVEVN